MAKEKKTELEKIRILERIEKKRILNLEEAAVLSEMEESYLYQLTNKQKIPHSKPNGGFVYFNKSKLEKWLERNSVDPIEE